MKSNFWIFLLLLLPMVSCTALKQGVEQLVTPPVIQILEIQPQSVSLSGLKLVIKVSIENPNSFEISAKDFGYKLQNGEHIVAEGQRDDVLAVASGERKIFNFSVSIQPQVVIKVFKKWLFSQEKTLIEWEVTAVIEAFFTDYPVLRQGSLYISAP